MGVGCIWRSVIQKPLTEEMARAISFYSDFALLHLNRPLPGTALRFRSAPATLNEKLILSGFPFSGLGLETCESAALSSDADSTTLYHLKDTGSGWSGSPVFDQSGLVVGLHAKGSPPEKPATIPLVLDLPPKTIESMIQDYKGFLNIKSEQFVLNEALKNSINDKENIQKKIEKNAETWSRFRSEINDLILPSSW